MSRLDQGQVHDVLIDQAWLQLPLPQREPELIRLLEECIEPDEQQPARTDVPAALYMITNGWLIFGSILRLGISLTNHVPVDALPFLSLVLGNGALIWYFRRTPRPRKERS